MSKPKTDNQLTIPPQVKYGVAIMELDNGQVIRVLIDPAGFQPNLGHIMRLIHGELEDLQAEHLAHKVLELTKVLAQNAKCITGPTSKPEGSGS